MFLTHTHVAWMTHTLLSKADVERIQKFERRVVGMAQKQALAFYGRPSPPEYLSDARPSGRSWRSSGLART